MFTSISGPELLMILILGLLLFGPRRLPQMGRTVGKAFAELRRATTEFKMNLEREVAATEIKETIDEVGKTVDEVKGAVSRDLQIEPDAPGSDDDSGKG